MVDVALTDVGLHYRIPALCTSLELWSQWLSEVDQTVSHLSHCLSRTCHVFSGDWSQDEFSLMMWLICFLLACVFLQSVDWPYLSIYLCMSAWKWKSRFWGVVGKFIISISGSHTIWRRCSNVTRFANESPPLVYLVRIIRIWIMCIPISFSISVFIYCCWRNWF